MDESLGPVFGRIKWMEAGWLMCQDVEWVGVQKKTGRGGGGGGRKADDVKGTRIRMAFRA